MREREKERERKRERERERKRERENKSIMHENSYFPVIRAPHVNPAPVKEKKRERATCRAGTARNSSTRV